MKIEVISRKVVPSPQSDATANVAALVAALEKIYATVPAIACKGKCVDNCSVIAFLPAETINVRHKGFALPMVTNLRPDLAYCTALDQKTRQCTIYDARPLICRLYAVVKAMQCPYGCRPKRWLSRQQTRDLKDAIHALLPGEFYYNHPAAENMTEFLKGLADDGIVPEGGWR